MFYKIDGCCYYLLAKYLWKNNAMLLNVQGMSKENLNLVASIVNTSCSLLS